MLVQRKSNFLDGAVTLNRTLDTSYYYSKKALKVPPKYLPALLDNDYFNLSPSDAARVRDFKEYCEDQAKFQDWLSEGKVTYYSFEVWNKRPYQVAYDDIEYKPNTVYNVMFLIYQV